MKRLTTPQKTWLTVGLGILLGGACVIFVTLPQRTAVIEKVKVHHERRTLLASLQKEQENFTLLNRGLTTAEETLKTLDQIILSTDQSLDLIAEIEHLADETRVTQDLNLAPVAASSTLQHTPTSIQLEGSYPDVLSFLQRLEHSPYYVGVQTVQIAPLEGDRVVAGLSGETYWLDL